MRSQYVRGLGIMLIVLFGAIATGTISQVHAAPKVGPASITRDPRSDKLCTTPGTYAYRADLKLPQVLSIKIIGSSDHFEVKTVFFRGCITAAEASKLDHLMNEDYWGHLTIILDGSHYVFSMYSLEQGLDVFRLSLQNFLLGLYPPSHLEDDTYLGMDVKLIGFVSPSDKYILIVPGVAKTPPASPPKCPKVHQAVPNRRCG